MKKIITKILTFFILFTTQTAFATTVIEGGVSIDKIPKNLFGSWRVHAKLDRTNSPKTFKPQSMDFWNMSRIDDELILDNPMSGANSKVSVKTVEENLIVFSKKTPYDNNKVLTDIVTIRLNPNNFSGINELKLESFSLIDNHLMKTETATYIIKGEKIAGESILID